MFWNLLNVFLWKNYKRILFFWKTYLLGVAIPLTLITFVFVTHGSSRAGSRDTDEINFEPIDADLNGHHYQNTDIYWAPKTEFYTELMYEIFSKLGLTASDIEAHGYKTEAELKAKEQQPKTVILVFEANENDTTKLQYKIKIQTNSFKINQIYCDSVIASQQRGSYVASSFLSMQQAIDEAYLELISNKSTSLTPQNVEYNHSPMKNIKHHATEISQTEFAYFSLVAILLPCLTGILIPLVEEKQDGIKEILSIATTYSFMNQVGYFIINFAICFIVMLFLLLEAVIFKIFDCTSIVFPFLLMLLFVLCIISFTFFISAFFDSVTFCQIVGFAFYALPIIFFNIIEVSVYAQQFAIFSPMSLYVYGMKILESYENSQRCFSGNDIHETNYPNMEHFSFYSICISLILTTIFYLFLYYYISNAFPGHHGTPESLFFMFTKSYWRRKIFHKFTRVNHENSNRNEFVEINGLTKEYSRGPMCGPKFTAVKNVSFSLPEQHISILLGHNGAGKTTTMEMITGITPPTKGKIIVDGEDNVAIYRTSIGYCPQHDVFISYLNCRDHLIFFGRLRGLNFKEAKLETRELLSKVQLTQSKHKPAKSLSRGMKRRLCLACAVIGNTKLVILDEPSSGLDPESRRDLWDVLLPLRKSRTILLTTHSMEEADVLGDKIIILDNGQVIAEGSTFKLKKTYGSGYTLKILMKENFKISETMNTIEQFIPNAIIKATNPPTLQITLPFEHLDKYSNALDELEKNSNEFGIDSIGVCNTTMEEVFLNSSTKKYEDKSEDMTDSKYIRIEEPNKYQIPNYLYLKQFFAIFYKKLIFIRRNWMRTLIHFGIPILTIFLTYLAQSWIQNALTTKNDYKELSISGHKIPMPDVILAIDRAVENVDQMIGLFKKIVIDDGGMPIIKYDISLMDDLLSIEKNNKSYYYERLLGGIEIRRTVDKFKPTLKVFYQNNILLSFPLLMNYIDNLLLKLNSNASYHITTINAPLDTVDINSIDANSVFVIILPMLFQLGFFFYIQFYVGLPFAEESSEFKLLQQIPSSLYWFTTYLADCICHTICSFAFLCMIVFCDTKDTLQDFILSYLFGYICLAGYVYIPILYVLTKLFKKLSIIYSIAIYMFFTAAVASTFFNNEKSAIQYDILFYILRLLPEFTMRYYLTITFQVQWNFNPAKIDDYYWTGVFEIILLMFILVVIYENIYLKESINSFIFTLKNVCAGDSKLKQIENNDMTSNLNVDTELDNVDSIVKNNDANKYILLASKLYKTYGHQQAVKGISFSVEKGECFGLLGMNGAGKTTTFKMMTLNSALTSGNIYINGYNSKTHTGLYSQQFGYCPETDALLEFMTAYETLKYIGWIKGISYNQLDFEINQWLRKVDLEQYKNIQVYQYSGGTKRKLNTAIAMMANPKLVFLDEPTTGVDPVSRRFMWHCIKQFQSEKKTVVLTSHSMDECEELCSRLAIMTTGQFRCIGFIQKLKCIFGTGYTILIKTFENADANQIQTLKNEIKKYYNCQLRDDYAGTLIYNIVQSDILWSETFRKVLKFVNNFKCVIEDFAINEISLEDIFLQFRDCDKTVETSYL